VCVCICIRIVTGLVKKERNKQTNKNSDARKKRKSHNVVQITVYWKRWKDHVDMMGEKK
jgi:hypothetical protein